MFAACQNEVSHFVTVVSYDCKLLMNSKSVVNLKTLVNASEKKAKSFVSGKSLQPVSYGCSKLS